MSNKEANNNCHSSVNGNVCGPASKIQLNKNQQTKNNNEEFASEFQVDNNRRHEAIIDRDSFEQERPISERTAWN
ncbi:MULTISPECIES: hypothetical protein [Lysinibacillus]|uniref:Uncharacterized protein n=1 Tax=Lysinibacillus antri TaxID=2498145 RepID=A0A3S0P5N8_9BACI|nr:MULTISPECIES: hypothetical protein [Lysinibacillus]RUL52018.1 hypothetical protein EK386_10500 [Lysinibacillus antri]TSI05951.1 hypothetical protein FJQ64_11115 [Lysinibacillus sp. BW-2-10]